MANYSTTIKNSVYEVSLDSNEYKVSVDTNDYKVSLSRVGAQGSQGNSVTNAYINSDSELVLTISNADGTSSEDIIAGDISQLDSRLNLSGITVGQGVIYDDVSDSLVPHSFTTASLSDVNNDNKADGAVLVYNSTSSKYESTTTLNNENTTIIGGSF